MRSRSLKTKVITGIFTGGMILSSAGLAFAANTRPEGETKGRAPCKNECREWDTEKQHQLDLKLEAYVKDNTITEDQAIKIKEAIMKKLAERKADFEKTKTMTEKQRKEYMESNKDKHIDPLKVLVDNGTITRAQADKIYHGNHDNKGSDQATPNTMCE